MCVLPVESVYLHRARTRALESDCLDVDLG